ncbi:DUF937 domain-containing protein [Membranihabitans marinus]|uniref:DUF937 domain-containing protein n=1 Tax=Membranihabitans marinus TaxID=1227546 RepID=UPI001F33D1D8|nr:DUF937 domain-containing protein [Membranihabitans marinus]
MGNRLFFVFQKEFKNSLADAIRSSGFIDLSESVDLGLEEILEVIHAYIIGGLIVKVEEENGANVLGNLLVKGGHNGEILEDISLIFDQKDSFDYHQKLGNSLLSFVFDEDQTTTFQSIKELMHSEYGIDSDDLDALNKLVIPFSMGIIGKEVKTNSFSNAQLGETLIGNTPILSEKFSKWAKVLELMPIVKENVTTDKKESVKPKEEGVESSTQKMGSQQSIKSASGLNIQVFYKNFFPWLATFIISAGSLYALRYFETQKEDSPVLEANSPFQFIQNDSLAVKSFSEVPWVDNVDNDLHNIYLDSLNHNIKQEKLVNTVIFNNANLHFEENIPNISMEGKKELDEILTALKKYNFLHLDIQVDGNPTFVQLNKELIDRRLKNIQDYFIVFGIEEERISVAYKISNPEEALDSVKNKAVEESPHKIDPLPSGTVLSSIHFLFSNQEKNI